MRRVVVEGVAVPAADGVLLATDVYRPDDKAPRPCLLQRGPYGKHRPDVVNGAINVLRAVDRGLAVAIQDCRGRFASEGRFRPFVHEADDGAASVEWLAMQPWCDGRVAMVGRSYSALAQWLTAATRPPSLLAVAPMFSGCDARTDWFNAGGAFERGFALLWTLQHLAPELLAREVAAGRRSPADIDELLELGDDIARRYQDLGDADRTALARLAPVVLAFLDDLPGSDRCAWEAARADVTTVSVPAFVVGGWFDVFLPGVLRAFAALPPHPFHRLVVGPWAHGGAQTGVFPERDFGFRASSSGFGLSDLQLDWLEHVMSSDVSESPRGHEQAVTAFAMGSDRWVHAPSWPPPGTSTRRFFLGPVPSYPGCQAQLTPNRPDLAFALDLLHDPDHPVPTTGGGTFLPGLEVAANAGPRDQRRLVERPDFLTAATEPLSAPVEIAGLIDATVFLDGALPGHRAVARLLDLAPDGTAWLVAEGAGSVPVVGEPAQVEIGHTWYRFPPGHRVVLAVSTTSFPRFGRHATDGGEDPRDCVRMVVAPGRETSLGLPVIGGLP